MAMERPVSDLRDNFEEVCEAVHQTSEPILLTKEGQGDMVLMSADAYVEMQLNWELYAKILVSEKKEELTGGGKSYTAEEVLQAAREIIWEKKVV